MALAQNRAEQIVEQEVSLHHELPPGPAAAPPSPALLDAARQWSELVWQAAARAGPARPDPGHLQRGLTLAEHPVFVCGVHRSGTTLIRNLLDGHPALVVLPSEGSYFTQFAPMLARVPPARHAQTFICEWLRRLANPGNQAPYWLLGRSTTEESPYVQFARSALGWWPEVEVRFGARSAPWPLIVVALAYASVRSHGLSDSLQCWVEKTPGNERFLDRLWRAFPAARIIHIVRDPVAIFASRKAAEERASGSFRRRRKALRELTATYRIASRMRRAGNRARYHIVRYEELVADPPEAMARIAHFIGIEPSTALLRPMVAGMPASANSSFGAAASAGSIMQPQPHPLLTSREHETVIACTGKWAAQLGYRQTRLESWARSQYLQLINGVWPARLFQW